HHPLVPADRNALGPQPVKKGVEEHHGQVGAPRRSDSSTRRRSSGFLSRTPRNGRPLSSSVGCQPWASNTRTQSISSEVDGGLRRPTVRRTPKKRSTTASSKAPSRSG